MKNTLLTIFGIALLGVIVFLALPPKQHDSLIGTNTPDEDRMLCFASRTAAPGGLFDEQFLVFNINNGEEVNGWLSLHPAEKDSKLGPISGTLPPLDQRMMGRTLMLSWNALAEGTVATEEVSVQYGEGNAAIGFGEMIENPDGTFSYKNKEALTYGANLTDVDCATRDPIQEIRAQVAGFGLVLQKVSLLAPDAKDVMADVYGPYISSDLLREWQGNPDNALGRLTSSPYPSSITVLTMKSVGATYEVSGTLIESTSTDPKVSSTPLTLTLSEENGVWKISKIVKK